MKSTSASSLSVCLALFIAATTILPGAESVAWVVGMQKEGYTGPFIARYDEWLVGSPRTVAYGGSFDLANSLGSVCAGPWNAWSSNPFADNDNYDFNCGTSAEEISANSGNVGFVVGGLNKNGATVAICSVTTQESHLCDSDTISDGSALKCTSYLECQ